MYHYKYPRPAVTVDCVVFGFDGVRLSLLLVERGREPFKGKRAFPGGFLDMDETAEECARRELREETGLDIVSLDQFHTFSAVGRDPRGRVISIAYVALVPISEVKGGDDAASAGWYPVNESLSLAFDHSHILEVALNYLKKQICFQPIGIEFFPDCFKLSQLQNLYEAIWKVKFDERNFAKKILSLNILEKVNSKTTSGNVESEIFYKFNKDKYDELKTKAIDLEFLRFD